MRLTDLDFSMPPLNSVFPFLEAIRPDDDPTWHIRRGHLLDRYDSVWATYSGAKDDSFSIAFYDESDL
jgi:hypothetical protein